MAKELKRAERPAKREKERKGGDGPVASVSRHLLTGAALGLYFGLFFRPARQPSLLLVIGLSLLSALALTLLQLRHAEKRHAGTLVPYFFKAWGGFALVLAMLELRHFFYELGGRLLTTVFTTLYGTGLGYVYAKTTKQEAR